MGYGLVSGYEREGGLPDHEKIILYVAAAHYWKISWNWKRSPWIPIKPKQKFPIDLIESETLPSKMNSFHSYLYITCTYLWEEDAFIFTSHFPSGVNEWTRHVGKKGFHGRMWRTPNYTEQPTLPLQQREAMVTCWMQILTIQNCTGIDSSTKIFI